MSRWVYRLRGFYPGWPNNQKLTPDQVLMLRIVFGAWMALCFIAMFISHGTTQATYGFGAFLLGGALVGTWKLKGEKK